MPEILQTSNDDKNEPKSSQNLDEAALPKKRGRKRRGNDENNDMVDEALEPAKKRARPGVTSKTPRVRTSARCLQPKTVNKIDNKKQATGRRYRGYAVFDDDGNEVDRDGNILVHAAKS
ncbi:hypothetical protein C8J57DRAFT_1537308 [Mycena rebaudengoi]|nr:hypothetical protein C8J57DRAFT_1537308 [Mycena rebaudengoi]